MKTFATLCFYCFLGYSVSAQDISITFSAKGEASSIDSITALNQRTTQQVTLPGSATLVLKKGMGIDGLNGRSVGLTTYPNPFSDESKIRVTIDRPQEVHLKIINMMGQVVAQKREFLQTGASEYLFRVTVDGIYSIVLNTKDDRLSRKVVNMGTQKISDGLGFIGRISGSRELPDLSSLKTASTGYTLDYSDSDMLNFTCYSGVMTTIVTDSPTTSKNIEVGFAGCTDQDGKNYKVVTIGTQTWMAENLAYLPAVSPSNIYSNTEKHYYVYNYEGISVSEAKSQPSYTTYGVLYNLEAALFACPQGWRLPSDEDWKVLEKFLGMSESDANTKGIRNSGSVGGKLKETGTSHWTNPNTGANNSSGFTALPGGDRDTGAFFFLGYSATFWTSTEDVSPNAWERTLSSFNVSVSRFSFYRWMGFSVRCVKNE